MGNCGSGVTDPTLGRSVWRRGLITAEWDPIQVVQLTEELLEAVPADEAAPGNAPSTCVPHAPNSSASDDPSSEHPARRVQPSAAAPPDGVHSEGVSPLAVIV